MNNSRLRRLMRAWPWTLGGGFVALLLVLAMRPETVQVELAEVRRQPGHARPDPQP